MLKKVKSMFQAKKFKKGDVNVGLIIIALGVIIAIGIFLFTKGTSTQLSSTATQTSTTLQNATSGIN